MSVRKKELEREKVIEQLKQEYDLSVVEEPGNDVVVNVDDDKIALYIGKEAEFTYWDLKNEIESCLEDFENLEIPENIDEAWRQVMKELEESENPCRYCLHGLCSDCCAECDLIRKIR